MARRFYTSKLLVGQIPLDPTQARHAREALRLKEGDEVELFDEAGTVATGKLLFIGSRDVAARVEHLHSAPKLGLQLTVAAAVPKGERADWMVEKLSELGVAAFIPLSTQRSVVKPDGRNKLERWMRIATESAKQSRRPGVMRVDELRPLAEVVGQHHPALYLSTTADARPIQDVLSAAGDCAELTLLIGPEGGWTDEETRLFAESQIPGVKLTSTILRIETAAITAAAISMILSVFASSR